MHSRYDRITVKVTENSNRQIVQMMADSIVKIKKQAKQRRRKVPMFADLVVKEG